MQFGRRRPHITATAPKRQSNIQIHNLREKCLQCIFNWEELSLASFFSHVLTYCCYTVPYNNHNFLSVSNTAPVQHMFQT